MESVTLRKASSEDCGTITSLWLELLEYHKPFNQQIYRFKKDFKKIYRDFLERSIRAKNHCVFVAVVGDEVVGHAMVEIKKLPPIYIIDKEAFIDEIIVTKRYRGRGVGKKLLTACEQWAKQKGLTQLSLTVHTKNKSAVSMYEGYGFDAHHQKMSKWF